MIGMDDYHWVVLDIDGVTHLVHKSMAALSVMPSGAPHERAASYEKEVLFKAAEEALFKAAEGFRSHMLKNVYHHTEGEGDASSSDTKERTP